MTIVYWILLILGIILTIPILALLVMKWGTVGFYRGKEAWKRRIDVTTINDKRRKHEKF